MKRPAGIPSHFHGTFHLGRVSSVNKDKHTVQVEHFEIDGWVSGDLQMLVTRPGDYSLPAVGTPVMCIVLDGEQGFGFVLGCFYTDNDAPPLSNAGHRSLAGDDVRLGNPEASDKAALSSKVNSNFDKLWDLISNFFGASATPVNEPGNGAPSALQTAIRSYVVGKILSSDLPFDDVDAEKVSIE
jgi:phage baseplate assembly protein gpV